MALYDNKSWLLSHIRNSFISTDDTGMCEMVMVGEDIPRKLIETLNTFDDPDESDEDEDEIEHESYDIQFDIQYRGQRSNTVSKPDKIEQAKKRAVKIKHLKWEKTEASEGDMDDLFSKKIPHVDAEPKKSMLAEQLEKCTNLPQNPYLEFTRFDGSAQVGIPTRKYKIFLTMLPEEQRNYPMTVCCIATAKIQELIGLICLKCSTVHGDFPLQPVTNYGLYITEEDGEVDRDFACLDPKECVAKFGFTCLGLAEHRNVTKTVSFENTETLVHSQSLKESLYSSAKEANDDETKQSADLELMEVHTTAMEAPLYQSFQVYIINKVRAKVEIHLGISGEKIEIDPVQQRSSKFALVRQKAVSHHIDSVAWCEITDTKSNRSSFRVVYSLSFGSSNNSIDMSPPSLASPVLLQTSASFKHYDFEADHHIAKEIVQKINLILELRSSISRKEYLAAKERKLYRKKNFNLNKGNT